MVTTPPEEAEFSNLIELISDAGIRHSPSELHGLVCGLISAGIMLDDAAISGAIAGHVGAADGLPAKITSAYQFFAEQAQASLQGEALALDLLLPADDEDLGMRVAALAQWCEGFLVGFGTGSAGVKDSNLSAGLQEALSDLSAISQVDTPEDDSDDEEDMYEQVAEHTRMAAIMVFTESALRLRKHSAKEQAEDGADEAPLRH